MTKYEITGEIFHLEDEVIDVDFEFDDETGMVEIYIGHEQGGYAMYVKREIALSLALWLKGKVVNN